MQILQVIETARARASLYHWSSRGKAIHAFRTNSLLAKFAHREIGRKGISLTRNARYDHSWSQDSSPVRFEFDQDRLRQRFKLMPVEPNYHRFHNTRDRRVKDDPSTWDEAWMPERQSEFTDDQDLMSEEYLVGDIRDLNRYIRSIHLDLVRPDDDGFLIELAIYLTRYKIDHTVKVHWGTDTWDTIWAQRERLLKQRKAGRKPVVEW